MIRNTAGFRTGRVAWAALALGVAAAATMASRAEAGQQISVDFESYPTGAIADGYDGWKITNPNWDQEVTTSGALAGNKSWRISNKVASGSYSNQPFSPALTNPVGEGQASTYFEASMLFTPLASNVLDDGITISIDNGTGQRGNYMRIGNRDSNDAANWTLTVYDYDGPNAQFNQSFLSPLTAGQTYTLGFSMQFNAGANNDVWKVYLDNTLLFTGVGWEDYFRDFAPTYSPSPVLYDRLLFRAGGVQANGAAGVLFDNITYADTSLAAVPEPSTLAMGGVAVLLSLGGAWRHRRRKAGAATV